MPDEIRAADVVVNSALGFLSHASARAIEAVCLLMLDSFDLETLMSVIPCCRAACIVVRFAMRADD